MILPWTNCCPLSITLYFFLSVGLLMECPFFFPTVTQWDGVSCPSPTDESWCSCPNALVHKSLKGEQEGTFFLSFFFCYVSYVWMLNLELIKLLCEPLKDLRRNNCQGYRIIDNEILTPKICLTPSHFVMGDVGPVYQYPSIWYHTPQILLFYEMLPKHIMCLLSSIRQRWVRSWSSPRRQSNMEHDDEDCLRLCFKILF